jgi:hypothetical protein
MIYQGIHFVILIIEFVSDVFRFVVGSLPIIFLFFNSIVVNVISRFTIIFLFIISIIEFVSNILRFVDGSLLIISLFIILTIGLVFNIFMSIGGDLLMIFLFLLILFKN